MILAPKLVPLLQLGYSHHMKLVYSTHSGSPCPCVSCFCCYQHTHNLHSLSSFTLTNNLSWNFSELQFCLMDPFKSLKLFTKGLSCGITASLWCSPPAPSSLHVLCHQIQTHCTLPNSVTNLKCSLGPVWTIISVCWSWARKICHKI